MVAAVFEFLRNCAANYCIADNWVGSKKSQLNLIRDVFWQIFSDAVETLSSTLFVCKTSLVGSHKPSQDQRYCQVSLTMVMIPLGLSKSHAVTCYICIVCHKLTFSLVTIHEFTGSLLCKNTFSKIERQEEQTRVTHCSCRAWLKAMRNTSTKLTWPSVFIYLAYLEIFRHRGSVIVSQANSRWEEGKATRCERSIMTV